MNSANSTAKNIEWVKPRWPNMSPYRTPNSKLMTSKSGTMEQTDATRSKADDAVSWGSNTESAIGTAG